MIVRLKGSVVELGASFVVLDVGGVGYELGISTETRSKLPPVGTPECALFVRMVVREDAMELYGFMSQEERTLFDRLKGVSGVGSKLALSVLSTFSPKALAEVVSAQDVRRMSTVPGVGKKTAGRLLMELSDAFSKDYELKALLEGSASAPVAPAGAAGSSLEREAREALVSMGFTSREAELAMGGYAEAGINSIEDLLQYSLRRLGKGL